MVIVHNTNMHKYYDKQRKVKIIKYFINVKKVSDRQAIYLQK